MKKAGGPIGTAGFWPISKNAYWIDSSAAFSVALGRMALVAFSRSGL